MLNQRMLTNYNILFSIIHTRFPFRISTFPPLYLYRIIFATELTKIHFFYTLILILNERNFSMKSTKHLTLTALFLALGLILPFFTGQIREIGNKLLPMHIPVLLCGFICGWKYGLFVGFTTPLLRFVLFSMPVMPKALIMSFELATYGATSGILYQILQKSKFRIYISLIGSMILGRIIWGFATFLTYHFGGTSFTLPMFISGCLLNAIPGITIQIVLLPILILFLEKSGSIHDRKHN